ncbi:hypothetical protein PUR49_00420, partial [Streptomyces sp. BE147]|uniref:hypothetical protein n=1 Tax=Streptomyces sp. BE147 TaxID=3002524 RepID=UPI002E7985C0
FVCLFFGCCVFLCFVVFLVLFGGVCFVWFWVWGGEGVCLVGGGAGVLGVFLCFGGVGWFCFFFLR